MVETNTGRILGAVLAGGLSTRFGSDKAQALLDGRRLIDHAYDMLAAQCDTVILIGREESGHISVPDWPAPHMGPLGGLAGALRHAVAEGYNAVLTCGVDSPALPHDPLLRLSPAPACLYAQPVIGLWPVDAGRELEEILTGSQNHSVRHFVERIGARHVELVNAPVNVNTRADLTKITQHR